MTTDDFKVCWVRQKLMDLGGMRDMTQILFATAPTLSDDERALLRRFADDLRDDLVGGKSKGHNVDQRERLAALAVNPPTPDLLQLAVLFSGVETSWMARGRAGLPAM